MVFIDGLFIATCADCEIMSLCRCTKKGLGTQYVDSRYITKPRRRNSSRVIQIIRQRLNEIIFRKTRHNDSIKVRNEILHLLTRNNIYA